VLFVKHKFLVVRVITTCYIYSQQSQFAIKLNIVIITTIIIFTQRHTTAYNWIFIYCSLIFLQVWFSKV